MKFLVKNSSYSFANALRRIIIEEVPTLAIEDIEIRENSSPLYDEILALRLGLIPLKTDLKTYVLAEKCKCGGIGCAMCQLKLTLKEINQSSEGRYVYSSSLKSKDPKAKPVSTKFPITYLGPGQKVVLEATAQLGKGKVHAKWQPAHVYYKYVPHINIKKQPKEEISQKVVEMCPKKIFEIKNNQLVINKDKILDCDLCLQCCDITKDIKIEEDDKNFIFYIESFGQMDCKTIVKTALEIIDDKCNELAKLIKR